VKEDFGLPLEMPPFQGRIHPDFRSPRFIESLFDCGSLLSHPSCELLLESRNRVGKISLPLTDLRSRTIVIKEFRTQGIDRLKSAFLPSKARKAWRGAGALYNRRLNTPCPIAFLEKRKGLFVDESYFISEAVEDVLEIRYLFPSLPEERLKKLLAAVAGDMRLSHEEGIHHRDLSDGNILVGEDKEDYRLFFIDTNRIRLRRRIGIWRRVKSLIRLGIPRDFQRFFLEQYCRTGRLPGKIWLWYRFNKASFTWYIEVKKKLHLRQIARKLKIQ
jgi:serine/threonine protein kinase